MSPLPSSSTAQSGWLFPLVNDLVEQIFIGEKKRLSRVEIALIDENHRLGGPADWFQYQNKVIHKPETKCVIKGQVNRLHASLYPAMGEHSKDLNQVELDKNWVRQALVLLLRDCTSLQDLVDALPNSLHATLAAVRPGAKHLKRIREETWSIQDNPRALAQYNKLREKMEFYNITALVY